MVDNQEGAMPQGNPAKSNQEVVTIDQWCGANGYDGVTKECLLSAAQQEDPKVRKMAEDYMKQMIGQQAMGEGEAAPGGPAPVPGGKGAPVKGRVGPPQNVVAKKPIKVKKGGGY